jgi:hypothetical protein
MLVPGEKALKERANNKLNPHDAKFRNQTRATVMRGKLFYHYTIFDIRDS